MCVVTHLIKINCMQNISQQQSLGLSHLLSKEAVALVLTTNNLLVLSHILSK